MRFSVIIATRNRAAMAVRAARSALAQTFPYEEFEVVVVDNGSTDGTIEALRALAGEAGGVAFRALEEPEAGVSRARNLGLRSACGKYLAFLDDDAVAPPDWLARIASCQAALDPKPEALGGPIEPLYDCPKPAWFLDKYEQRSWGPQERALGPGEVLSGSNMIWDREVLVRIGGFDVAIGPSGVTFAMGEDTELCLRLRDREPGATIWYSPELKVLHSVTQRRFSTAAALTRGYKEGLGWVAASPPQGAWARCVEILRRCLILAYLVVVSLFSFQWLYRPRNWCFEKGRRIFVQIGNIVGLLQAAGRRKA